MSRNVLHVSCVMSRGHYAVARKWPTWCVFVCPGAYQIEFKIKLAHHKVCLIQRMAQHAVKCTTCMCDECQIDSVLASIPGWSAHA